MTANKNKTSTAVKSNSAMRTSYLVPFKLVHHRHSFKLVHRYNTNYPLLGFIVLLTGLFCIGWTSFATGDTNGGDYVVTAVVPANHLTVPATITYPTDGQQFNDQIITVSGDCPTDSYVNLYRNGVYSGTDLCQSNGHWYVQTSLLAGSNKLQAQDYNVTNEAGPASAAVTVSYIPATTASPSDNGSGNTRPIASGSSTEPAKPNQAAQISPLILTGDFTYQGVYAAQPLLEKVFLSGGRGPYALSIDWGDGSSDLSSHPNGGDYSLRHIYPQPGDYENSYTIKITASDADGQKSVLQIIAIVTQNQTGTGVSGLRPPSGGKTIDSSSGAPFSLFWRVVAPTYGAIFVGLTSFWLGERRELRYLRQRAIAQHRRRPHRL